ncbi:MAG: hypothetical protein V1729_05950 [Candidatus Woesearchaeota archaeon]
MTINILVVDELSDIATEFLLDYTCRRELGIEAYFSLDFEKAKESMAQREYSAVLVEPKTKDPANVPDRAREFIGYANEQGIPVMIFTDEGLWAMKRKYGMIWGKDYRSFVPKDSDLTREMRTELKRILER